MKTWFVAISAVALTGCFRSSQTDVSDRSDRNGGFVIGSTYSLQTDVFLRGWKYGAVLEDAGLLAMVLPDGPEDGAVPESLDDWSERKFDYPFIYAVVLRGTTVRVTLVREISTLQDHYTQVIACIEDGEFAGLTVDLRQISHVSEDCLLVAPDGANLKKGPNQPPQRNAGSRPPSGDSSASETPSSLGPRG